MVTKLQIGNTYSQLVLRSNLPVDAPDDLEGLEHYCKALAFILGSDLSDMRSSLHGRCFSMGADDDFQEAESLGYALQHAATGILALAEIGVGAACHLKELKAKATPGEAS